MQYVSIICFVMRSDFILGTGCVDLRTGNCYTEYNISRNGLPVCGGDITTADNNANNLNRGIVVYGLIVYRSKSLRKLMVIKLTNNESHISTRLSSIFLGGRYTIFLLLFVSRACLGCWWMYKMPWYWHRRIWFDMSRRSRISGILYTTNFANFLQIS